MLPLPRGETPLQPIRRSRNSKEPTSTDQRGEHMQASFQYSKQEVLDARRCHFLIRGEMRLFRCVLFVLLAFAAYSSWGGFVSFAVVVAIVLMLMLLVMALWYILPFSIYKKAATFKEFIKL